MTRSETTFMTRLIAIIRGHPDASSTHLPQAMAAAYADAATAGGHEARRDSAMIGAGDLDTPGNGIGRPASCA